VRQTPHKENAHMATVTETRTDAQIQEDVLAELKWDPRVSPNEIGVIVENGVVTLTGWADACTKRWAAEKAAHRVRGVDAVVNEIDVRIVRADERSDADIAAAVVRALEWDAFVPIDNLDVTVSKGRVTLKGEVEWQYQRKDAERVLRRLAGVKGLTNRIRVNPTVGPRDLKEKIEQAFARSTSLDATNVQVAVEGSQVILTGKVRSWAEREEAQRQAWAAPGVTAVDTRVTIRL
jgi:osmotically-inducible protein OsmY